jgi:glutamine amidotransferase
LGICLGAQLLTEGSEEGGSRAWDGLRVKQFNSSLLQQNQKTPHGLGRSEGGYNSVLFETCLKPVYFVHHFTKVANGAILSSRPITDIFTAGVQRENIYGVQFHPEKS